MKNSVELLCFELYKATSHQVMPHVQQEGWREASNVTMRSADVRRASVNYDVMRGHLGTSISLFPSPPA